jgi:outer membrane protein TolC
MFKKITAVVLGLVMATSCALPAAALAEDNKKQEISLPQAMELALKNNNQYTLNKLAVEKAKLKLDEDNYTEGNLKDNMVNTYELYMAKKVAPEVSKMNLAIAESNLKNSDNNIKLGVERNYYNLLSRIVALNNANNALTRAEDQLKITQAKLKAGLVTKYDLMSDEVNVAGKKSSVNTAKNEYQKSVINLNRSLGLSLNTVIEPTSKFTYSSYKVDVDKEVKAALENDIEAITARESQKVAQVTFDVVKGYYPSIVYSYKEKELALAEANENYKKTMANVEIKVKQAYFDLMTSEENYKTRSASLESAKEAYRIVTLKYKNGLATRLEVDMKSDSLSELEAAIMGDLYRYNTAVSQFKYGIYTSM